MITIKEGRRFRLNENWWKPTQKEWVPVLMADHPTFWEKESDPTTGRPWKRLSPGYAKEKNKKYPSLPILRLTGKMQDTAFIFVRGDTFVVSTTHYGGYNQFGTSRMPARPWMGVPDISLRQIVPIAWKHILSQRNQ